MTRVYAEETPAHKRIKLAKHIVNGSGVTKEMLEAWIATANQKWNCSLVIEDGEPDTVNASDIGKTKTPGAIDVYGTPVADDHYGACYDQRRIEVCADAKPDTLAHEIGHWFGLGDEGTGDEDNLMYSGCNRTGDATVPPVNQSLVRVNASTWLRQGAALTSGLARDVIDDKGDVWPDPGLGYLDIDNVVSFFDVWPVDPEGLSLSITMDDFMPFDGELGFMIESDGDPATGQAPEGFDYALYLNPLSEELHFERFDIGEGWVALDLTGIDWSFTYYYPDYKQPDPTLPICQPIGVRFTLPEAMLERGKSTPPTGFLGSIGYLQPRTFEIRGFAADVSGIDYAPNTPDLMELTMYFKRNYLDYAQSGVPDFDQRQDNWVNPLTARWSWCGPIAVANSLWWMDSRFEPNPVQPPTINDGFPLLTTYGAWDDHDPQNLDPFAADLAWLMDTDGKRTGIVHSRTTVWDMQSGIDQYLVNKGLRGIFYEKTLPMPTFEQVAEEVHGCEDVVLLLGFWQDQGTWQRVGGHYVTVAGIDVTNHLIAFSDPILNNAEPVPEGTKGPGRVLPGPHGPPYPHSTSMHNDSSYVSQDIYAAAQSPSPGNPAFGLPYYNTTFENFIGQNFNPGEMGTYIPGLQVYTEVEFAVVVSPEDWYFKGWPNGYADYALNGVPDFDQRQWGSYNWTNPYPPVNQWSHCGPVAVANSLWWLDSQFEPEPVSPPTVHDKFGLVQSYNPAWDDHDAQNVVPLVEELAYLMDTDGIRTGTPHCGTSVHAMEAGIDAYLSLKGMDWKFYEHTLAKPDYPMIVAEVLKSQDVTLLLGFWQTADGQNYWRIGGHYVTVAGVDPSNMTLAISDPIVDYAEWTGYGHVAPPPTHPHTPLPPHTVHNDAQYVSHDIYKVGPSPSPGGIMGFQDYYIIDELANVFGSCQNFPEELLGYEGEYVPGLPIFTEIEYAVIVSCKTGIVAAGSEDTNLYVWDFYGTLQWQAALGNPVVSVAMDDNGRFIAAGTRYAGQPPITGSLWLFDNSLGSPPGNVLWTKTLNISTSYDGGWAGSESKSVDVKYNSHNGQVVVAAATDQGLYLYDQAGALIWNYYDGPPYGETIVEISQDGNYIVCASHESGRVHYFSHMRDGVPGWQASDETPVYTTATDIHAYWVAISGDGCYVAVTSALDQKIYLYNNTAVSWAGSGVWMYNLPAPAFWRVDMPCHGRSVVAVNDDPSDFSGARLIYWDDGGDNWTATDSAPVWVYWAGKETGGAQNPLSDFYTVAISDNGDYVATGGAAPSKAYLLNNTGTMQQAIDVTVGSTLQSIDLTFTGKYGAGGDNAGVLWFFEKDLGLQWSYATPSGASIHCVAVSKIYPCMLPYPNHDVAITNVVPDDMHVSPGGTVSVTVTVTNQGNHLESFFDVFLEVLLDGGTQPGVTPQGTTVASLDIEVSLDFVFSWDTTGLSEDNYTLLGRVEIVQDEIDVYDNTFIDGVVEVETQLDVHDVAVTALYSPKTIVGKGYYCKINVTAANEGDYTETFNVNLYANKTAGVYVWMGLLTVSSLPTGSSVTLTLTWNASLSIGNYTLSAIADTVDGETETEDNTRFDGNIYIGVPCDVTGPTPGVPDGKTDMRDIAYICSKFMTTPASPNWDPNCDVTGPTARVPDDKVDMRDISDACTHFGEIDP